MMPIVYVAGCLLISFSGLSLVRSARWWIRFADFPRLQIAVGLAIVGGLFLVLLERPNAFDMIFGAALLVSLAHNFRLILPYTRLAPRRVLDASPGDEGRVVRIIVANVLMENERADDFIRLVRRHDPDIVLALETNDWWDRQLRALDADYPHAIKQPQDNHYGLHFFSKLEVVAAELRFLVDDDVPSIRVELRLRSGDVVAFNGVHPRPPVPQQGTEQRDAELLIVGREVKTKGLPAIVAGDLNDVAWSHTTKLFQRISGLLDPRQGRGLFSTFHANYPLLRWPLDHVFHDETFTLVRLQCLETIGSDHLPVLAELKYQPAAEAAQEPPRADAADHEEARELIAKGEAAS